MRIPPQKRRLLRLILSAATTIVVLISAAAGDTFAQDTQTAPEATAEPQADSSAVPVSPAMIQLPPVSDKRLESFTDYLITHLKFSAGFEQAEDLPVPPAAQELRMRVILVQEGVEGHLIVGFRRIHDGNLMVVLPVGTGAEIEKAVNTVAEAARAQLESLQKDVMTDVLSNAAVLSYNLSYIKTDRAMGALKAMGYNVVEMQQKAGTYANKAYSLEDITDYRLPIITSFVDSETTSLVQTRLIGGPVSLPDLGGRSFTDVTDSSAQQRLMILYDPDDEKSLSRLVSNIEEIVDIPAQQILIEGLILEVNEDKLRELGAQYNWRDGRLTTSFLKSDTIQPFIIDYNDFADDFESLQIKLRALVEQGTADILSKPSVLALNNHQARIRIGSEVPITTTVTSAATTTLSVSYFFMGIVLNIKPRISRDQSEVSMQIEALVSSRGPTEAVKGVEVAPIIDSRVVQTFARVANNTPFIIGGLIAHDIRERETGIPLLKDIPLIGALFRSTSKESTKNEVIVVLTPRVVPLDTEVFYGLTPRDSDKFDIADRNLFRNTYRIRSEDKFDLTFVDEDSRYRQLAARSAQAIAGNEALAEVPAIRSLIEKNIPGETPLMIRMLFEIVRAHSTGSRIADDRIIMLQPQEKDGEYQNVRVRSLERYLPANSQEPDKALVLQFDRSAHARRQLMPPLNIYKVSAPERSDYDEWMRSFNKMNDDGTFETTAIVIRTDSDLLRLKSCLVLKELLQINNFPARLRVKDFPIGMQILYPNIEGNDERNYVIDAKVAELYYMSDYYYQCFQRLYNAELDQIEKLLEE